MVMNEFVVYVALVLLGACFGSFAGATVWRLRAKQLESDKKAKERYSKEEYSRLKKLLGKKVKNDRSQCLECGYELKWYDLIPVVSWLSLRGRCRNCHHFIGWFELFMELGLIAFFVLSYMFWPGGIESTANLIHFILWLAAGVVMAVLFAYDTKWFLLPDSYSLALAVIGLAIVSVSVVESQHIVGTLISAAISVGILAGLYGALYAYSKGRWVGFGDVKLGIGLGLLLVDWRLALLALFLANLIGCLIVIPLLATKKLSRRAHVPFGPMLISGAVVAWFVGLPIIESYMQLLGIVQ